MFQPDPSIRFVPASREQVVALVESINQSQVSIPGKSPQAVQGFLCGLRNPAGTFSIFVALHLPRTGENVVYLHPRRELSLDEYRAVEIEGLHFLESMGFMLETYLFGSSFSIETGNGEKSWVGLKLPCSIFVK